MRRLSGLVVAGLGIMMVASMVVTSLWDVGPRPAAPPQAADRTFVGDVVDGVQDQIELVRAMECPPDMPDCTKTARERHRKWLRGGYGYTRQWRLHYAHRIKRRILNVAAVKWGRKYNTRFHRRREWRDFTDNPRMCVAYGAMCCYVPATSDYCRRKWLSDPRRIFVKNVLVCAGQIGLAIIGTRGTSGATRKTIIGGTGALCTWDKMP